MPQGVGDTWPPTGPHPTPEPRLSVLLLPGPHALASKRCVYCISHGQLLGLHLCGCVGTLLQTHGTALAQGSGREAQPPSGAGVRVLITWGQAGALGTHGFLQAQAESSKTRRQSGPGSAWREHSQDESEALGASLGTSSRRACSRMGTTRQQPHPAVPAHALDGQPPAPMERSRSSGSPRKVYVGIPGAWAGTLSSTCHLWPGFLCGEGGL